MQIYYPWLTFNVGDTFPIENPHPGQEGPVLATHAEGIHLILFSNNVAEDLPIWGTQPLGLALTAFGSIPFLVLTFQDSPLTLLYSLNVYGIIGDERGPWLRSISTNVNLFLVDNATGQLACIRQLDTKLLATLRHICREQLKEYADGEQVAIAVEQLLNPPHDNPVTVQRVFERARLSNLVVLQYPTSNPVEE